MRNMARYIERMNREIARTPVTLTPEDAERGERLHAMANINMTATPRFSPLWRDDPSYFWGATR